MAEQPRQNPSAERVTAPTDATPGPGGTPLSPGQPGGTPLSPGQPGGTPAPAGIGLRRIDHIGVAVPDLERAIEFYENTFGMRCVHVEENAEQGVREAMMSVGPDPAGGMVQLLAPLSPASTIAKFLDRHGPGIQQVAYTVADVEVAAAELRARGVRLLYDEAKSGTAGSRVNFVHPKDAGGILVELVQPAQETTHPAPDA